MPKVGHNRKTKRETKRNPYPLCCYPSRWSASGSPLGRVGLLLLGRQERDARQGTKISLLDYKVCGCRGELLISECFFIFMYRYSDGGALVLRAGTSEDVTSCGQPKDSRRWSVQHIEVSCVMTVVMALEWDSEWDIHI